MDYTFTLQTLKSSCRIEAVADAARTFLFLRMPLFLSEAPQGSTTPTNGVAPQHSAYLLMIYDFYTAKTVRACIYSGPKVWAVSLNRYIRVPPACGPLRGTLKLALGEKLYWSSLGSSTFYNRSLVHVARLQGYLLIHVPKEEYLRPFSH